MNRTKNKTLKASTSSNKEQKEQNRVLFMNDPLYLPKRNANIMDCTKCAKSFPNFEAFANHTRTEHSEPYPVEGAKPWTVDLIHNVKVEIESKEQSNYSSLDSLSSKDTSDSDTRQEDDPQMKRHRIETKETKFSIVIIKEENDTDIEESLSESPNAHQSDVCGQSNLSLKTQTGTSLLVKSQSEAGTDKREDVTDKESKYSRRKKGELGKNDSKINISRKETKNDKTQPGQKRFSCDLCAYKCNKRSNLKQHNRIHSGEKPFACDLCDYRCNKKEHLKNHSRTHTGEKPFACDQCDYRCTQKEHLKNHSRIHTGITRFACDLCDYKCNHKIHLEYHSRTHTGLKPFACQMCDYKCSTKSSLKQHIVRHSDEKPFACNVCDYRSNNRGNLRQHSRIHTGEKPFACHICDYKCGRKVQLKEHMRNHTGEKRFACDLCNYRCKQKDTLKYHSTKHTGDKPFACSLCDFRCRKKFSLNRHAKTHIG